MPSIAAMLGRRFWWPVNVPSRPPRAGRRPVTPHEETVDAEATGPLRTAGQRSSIGTNATYERSLRR
jgi:uncharacterized membrane protein YdfJ with MMPL/SSD domain